ncbi:hypothetical protein ACKWTF_000448 [Chironomus riparius]
MSVGLCGAVTNVIHSVADGAHDGLWKKKWSWKAKWVKHWKPKTIYVSNWTRVWTPFKTTEYIPFQSIPPPSSPHDVIKSSTHYHK